MSEDKECCVKYEDMLSRSMIRRIVNWNHARYDQVFSPQLTFHLLDEELLEFSQSVGSEVNQLDALVDITYVAIGAMWKMGLSCEGIHKAIHAVCDANDTKSVTKTPPHIKANKIKGTNFVPPEKRLQEILNERV